MVEQQAARHTIASQPVALGLNIATISADEVKAVPTPRGEIVIDVAVAIFRVATPSEQPSLAEERYIALISKHGQQAEAWSTSHTLFGLQKKLRLNDVDWEEAENALASKGVYKVSR